MRALPFLLLALLALPAMAADQSPGLQPVPDLPPPPGVTDPDLQPQVTIRQKDNQQIEEFRLHGQLYMIRVTPSHGKPYYLIKPSPDADFVRQEDLMPTLVVPMWVIGTF